MQHLSNIYVELLWRPAYLYLNTTRVIFYLSALSRLEFVSPWTWKHFMSPSDARRERWDKHRMSD